MVIEASDRLNPDESGRSLPTIIRIYQLSNVGALEQASFQEVWHTPDVALGESLLAQEELTIYPEQTLHRGFDRNPEANFVVAMGIFRQPVGTTWRSVIALPAPRSEGQCAAQQGSSDPPPPPPIPHLSFFVENNRIEGTLELVAAPTSGGCAPGDPFCAAAQQAAPQAPEAPQSPEAPASPQAPAAPAPGGKP